MPYPTMMQLQNTDRVVHEAKLLWLMPGAKALTRKLTAAILERDGLLNVPPAPAVLRTAAAWQQAAASRVRAAALCHEVQQLCTRAVVLHHEAEQLCQPSL
jgi:hypothetical protein